MQINNQQLPPVWNHPYGDLSKLTEAQIKAIYQAHCPFNLFIRMKEIFVNAYWLQPESEKAYAIVKALPPEGMIAYGNYRTSKFQCPIPCKNEMVFLDHIALDRLRFDCDSWDDGFRDYIIRRAYEPGFLDLVTLMAKARTEGNVRTKYHVFCAMWDYNWPVPLRFWDDKAIETYIESGPGKKLMVCGAWGLTNLRKELKMAKPHKSKLIVTRCKKSIHGMKLEFNEKAAKRLGLMPLIDCWNRYSSR